MSEHPDAMPGDDEVIAATRRWVERAVIGLNLCPFARQPYVRERIAYRVSDATNAQTLCQHLRQAIVDLASALPDDCETLLLIHPRVLNDFLDYNDFLDVADALLEELDLHGVLQIASFHPDYCFADSEFDDVANCSNRSPYPILHLLREASIDRAVESGVDVDAIPERNIRTLQRLGRAGWDALWK